MLKHRNFLRAWHAKRYDGRPRKNPLFPDRESLSRLKIVALIVGPILVVIGGLWALMHAPFLSITSVQINGLTTLNPDNVTAFVDAQRAQQRWLIGTQNNAYIFDKLALTRRLQDSFQLESLSVTRNGRTIVVTAKEQILEIALKSGGKVSFYGVDGTLVRDASPEEGRAIDIRLGLTTVSEGETLPQLQPNMPVLVDLSSATTTTIAKDRIDSLLTLNDLLLDKQITPLTYTFATLEDPWVNVQTAQGFTLLVDLTQSLAAQITTLQVIRDANRTDAMYSSIDLRFGDHVYVK